MAKKKLREFGMDPLERLYYERMEYRKKAYSAKQRMHNSRKESVIIRQIGITGFSQMPSASIME